MMIPYFEVVMKFSYAPGRKHLLEKLRTFFGTHNATTCEEKTNEADYKENASWKYWKEKTDKFWS